MSNVISAWSFSRYNTHEQCAFKAKRLYVDKIPMATSSAMDRGLRVHKLGEDYLKGKIRSVPVEFARFSAAMGALKKVGAVAEEEWCFAKNWVPTGWFDEDAWLRVKIDVNVLGKNSLRIIDFKTGRVRKDHGDQLDLYAVSGFSMFDNLNSVVAELWYLDAEEKDGRGLVVSKFYNAKQGKKLVRVWNSKSKPILTDKKFIPNPSYLCRYCQFSKRNGDGSCRF